MSGPKSIISVNVNTQQFQAYLTLFNKYQAALAKTPAAWGAVNKATAASQKSNQFLLATMLTQTQTLARMIGQHRAVANQTQNIATAWQKTGSASSTVARNVGEITRSLVRWTSLTSVFTGLLGATLFGLDRMADTVSGMRRTSMGLGGSVGEQRAFGLNFGRYVDPGAMLSGVANAQYDIRSRGYAGLAQAGLLGYSQSHGAADVSVEILKRLPSLLGGRPKEMIGPVMEAMGLDQFGISSQDAARYMAAPQSERDKMEKQFGGDKGTLNIDNETGRKWQDFQRELDLAGGKIFTVFVEGLTPLTTPLGELSHSVTEVVETFLKTAKEKGWIEELGKTLHGFAVDMKDADLTTTAKNFVDDLATIARGLHWIAGFVPDNKGVISKDIEAYNKGGWGAVLRNEMPSVSFSPKSMFGGLFGGGGAARTGTASSMLGLIASLERSGDKAVSPAGAIGKYQVMPATGAGYGVPRDQLFDPGKNEMVAKKLLSDLIRRYSGNLDEVLVAYNAGTVRANKFRASGHDLSVLPAETRRYLERAHQMGVRIELGEKPGSNVIASAFALDPYVPAW